MTILITQYKKIAQQSLIKNKCITFSDSFIVINFVMYEYPFYLHNYTLFKQINYS